MVEDQQLPEGYRNAPQALVALDGSLRWTVLLKGEQRARLTKIPDSAVAQSRLRSLSELFHPAIDGSITEISSNESVYWVVEDDRAAFVPTSMDALYAAAIRLCEALAYLHQHDLGHGNLGPEAICSGQGGSVILRDLSPSSPDPGSDSQALGQRLASWLAQVTENSSQTTSREGLAELAIELQELPQDAAFLAVRDRLEDLRLSWQRGVPWNGVPRPLVEGARPVPENKAPTDSGRQISIPMVASGLAVLALTITWLVLDRFQPEPLPTAPEPVEVAVVEEPAETPRQPPTAEELEQLLADREAADAVLDEVINLQLDLRERAVEQWAPAALIDTGELITVGETAYRKQQFAEALVSYSTARDQLVELTRQVPAEIERRLQAGGDALLDWQAVTAAALFEEVLAIDESNPDALLGKKRASSLDDARALLKQARAAQRENRLYDARQLYRQVRDLDPLIEGPAQALVEIGRTLADEAFRSVVSEAMAALQANRWTEARAGFEQARRMRPEAQVVADGLLELDRRGRESDLQRLNEQADLAMSNQDWPAAVKAFEAMLAKDGTISAAQRGRAFAEQRARIDSQLTRLLEPPLDWLNQKGRRDVAQFLGQVSQLANPGRNIDAKASRLREYLQLSEQPVAVRFESDQQCEVLVYRVARLGQFAVEQLDLLPGNYVAVGARAGFRDVRREFSVPPGSTPDPVILHCDEPV